MAVGIDDNIVEAISKATPPITISILGINITLHEWVYIATLLYVVLQIVVIIPRVFRTFKKSPINKGTNKVEKYVEKTSK